MLEINFSQGELEAIEKVLSNLKNGTENVMSKAINATLSNSKKVLKDEVTKKYFISKKDVEKTLGISKASIANMTGKISSKGNVLELSHFKIQQSGKGVSAGVSKDKGFKLREETFVRNVANFTGGGEKSETEFKDRVFIRKKGSKRIGIAYGASVPGLLSNQEISVKILKMAGISFEDKVYEALFKVVGV